MKIKLLILFLRTTLQNAISQPIKAEVISSHGRNIYYELYGKGGPLFLFHAFTLSSKSWGPFVSEYAKDCEVYLVNLQDHEKSGPYKQRLSIKSAAEDLKHLIIQSSNFSHSQ